MLFEKVGPSSARSAFWCWHNTMIAKDVGDGIPRDLVADIVERVADFGVSPSLVLEGELNDQIDDLLLGRWTAKRTLGTGIVLLGPSVFEAKRGGDEESRCW